jgi:hypothetical protein
MSYKRSGNKWTVNEILSLQREYELLEWTVQQIAQFHERSVEAILYKLESEEFIDNFISARGYNNYSNKNDQQYDEVYDLEDDDDYEDYEDQQDEIVSLTHRVDYVENTVNEIKIMVTNFLNSMNNSISITSSLDM